MKTMKTIVMTVSVVFALFAGGCSRSPNEAAKPVVSGPTPNLKSDAERLRQATANAAEARKRADAAAAGVTASPAP